MTKTLKALLLCVAIFILSSTSAVEGAKTLSAPQVGDAPGVLRRFCNPQETSRSIPLPPAKGAWLIEMSRDGGMRPSKHTVQINSDGEIGVTTESYQQGRLRVDCSLKAKLSAEDLLRLKERLRWDKVSAWRERYDDPKHPVCCDQPTTHLALRWRGADGSKLSRETSWYPGSAQMRPADLGELAEIAQALWNKTTERCEDQRADD